MFDLIDNNENGHASLAEIDKGMRFMVGVPEIPDLSAMQLRAFNRTRLMHMPGKAV